MKLSEAIRLGASLRPQVFRFLTDDNGTCALGAALEAIGLLKHAAEGRRLPNLFTLFEQCPAPLVSRCPHCNLISLGCAIIATVIHLNDDHHWTREQIAAWVELQEQAREAAPEAPGTRQELQPC